MRVIGNHISGLYVEKDELHSLVSVSESVVYKEALA